MRQLRYWKLRGQQVTRSVMRFVNWTLRPDMEPDAPPITHRFRCLGEAEDGTPCGAVSEASEDFTTARDWVFAHVREQPEHRSFAEVIDRPWLVYPSDPAEGRYV
jgi:hypothetical protein